MESTTAAVENLHQMEKRAVENIHRAEKRASEVIHHQIEHLDHALHRNSSSSSGGSSGRSSRSSVRRGSTAQPEKGRLLLLLNKHTWLGEQGEKLAELLRWTMKSGDQDIVMVHENDASRGGCEFGHLFSTTPHDLLDDGIYSRTEP